MLNRNDWVVPHLNEVPRLTKPPLYFWCVAMLCAIFNNSQVNELIARIPSAVCAVLTLIFTYLIFVRVYNERAGLISSFVLAANILFFWYARQAAIDMMMVMFSTASVLFFLNGASSSGKSKTRYYLCMHVCFGLGMLTKGPVAVLLPLLGIITYLLWSNKVKELKDLCWFRGAAIFMIILLPWVIMVVKRCPGALSIFYNETFNRYTDAFDHNRPFFYYFATFLPYMLPWALALPFMVWRIVKLKYRELSLYKFPVSFFVPGFIFLSLSGSKRSYYLLPLFPFAAGAIGYYVSGIKVSDFKSAKLKKMLADFSGNIKYQLISVLGAILIFITLISYLNSSNKKYSAVDLCGKLKSILPQNSVFMTYKYSRPYLVYYMQRQIHSIESEEELNSTLRDVNGVYVLMQEKDFRKMNISGAQVVLSYPDFTKSKNDMVLITAENK